MPAATSFAHTDLLNLIHSIYVSTIQSQLLWPWWNTGQFENIYNLVNANKWKQFLKQMLLITILRMEGRRGRPRQKLDNGGRILETPGEGSTSRRMDSLDIWNCREADSAVPAVPADYLKKKERRTVNCENLVSGKLDCPPPLPRYGTSTVRVRV